MKRYLNTLFVTTQGAYLAKDGQTVAVRHEKEVLLRVPVHTLAGIVCFGQVSCSPFLMGFCAENGVRISFLSQHGRFLARVEGPVSGNVLLRREQYRRAEQPGPTSEIVRPIVAAKVANSRTVLQRALRDHPEQHGAEHVEAAVRRLGRRLEELQEGADVAALRGIEGDAARTYFGVFGRLIVSQKDEFFFDGRNRRPPQDNVNALLSFIYTLLVHDIRGALESVGLDPAVGFLHRDRPGRPSLALDLMEEFRAHFADRLALSLINRNQVQGRGFAMSESGAVTMDDNTRKTVLVAYQKRKQETLQHPFLNEQVPFGLTFHLQALLLARFLRGDLDGYAPFIVK